MEFVGSMQLGVGEVNEAIMLFLVLLPEPATIATPQPVAHLSKTATTISVMEVVAPAADDSVDTC